MSENICKYLCLQTSCISVKKRLQHRDFRLQCFPEKFAKFLKTVAASEVQVVFSKECGAKTSATVSNKYQIQLNKSICCRDNLEAATVDVL